MARRRIRSHEGYLVESLKDSQEALAYLNEFFRDDGGDDYQVLACQAVRNVIKARGFARVSAAAGIGRESLYKSFSNRGNPRLSTLLKVFHCLGFDLQVVARPAGRAGKASAQREVTNLSKERQRRPSPSSGVRQRAAGG